MQNCRSSVETCPPDIAQMKLLQQQTHKESSRDCNFQLKFLDSPFSPEKQSVYSALSTPSIPSGVGEHIAENPIFHSKVSNTFVLKQPEIVTDSDCSHKY